MKVSSAAMPCRAALAAALGTALVTCTTVAFGAGDASAVREAGPGAPAADEGTNAATDAAKKSQNPVADLISVPLQSNFNFGVGQDRFQYVLNIQPVLPISLGDSWNLIVRAILPVMDQPVGATNRAVGLGDTQATAFFAPKSDGGLTWGIGPIVQLPTATQAALGAEKWGIGPSAVVVGTTGPWVIGALVNQVWSFAGASSRAPVSAGLLQPFVNFNLPKGWFLVSAPLLTANWEAPRGQVLTIPVGGGFGRVMPVFGQMMNLGAQAYVNPVRPDTGADWQLRITVAFLFPR